MVRRRVLTGLAFVALIPITLSAVCGLVMITDDCFQTIYPEVRDDEERRVKSGWPVSGSEFLQESWGASPVLARNVVDLVSLIPVFALCAALGALRLKTAKVITWSLLASLVVVLPVADILEDGISKSAAYYVFFLVIACLSLGTWSCARLASERWLYAGIPIGSEHAMTQRAVCGVILIVIVAVSIYFWLMMTVFFPVGDMFKGMKFPVIM